MEKKLDDYEPDANTGDWVVWGVATAIVSGCLFWLLVYHLANWMFGL